MIVLVSVQKEVVLATNLAIDDKLIIKAQKIGYHKTKKEAVTTALKENIAHKKQLEVLDLFGSIESVKLTSLSCVAFKTLDTLLI